MTEAPPAVRTATSAAEGGCGLIVVRGADARTFLDAQLTRNVPAAGCASLAGYCSPKGRLLAAFVAWPSADGVHLLVAGDIAEAIAKRLKMYVLRAKATIALDVERLVETRVDDPGAPALAVWATAEVDGATWIRCPDADGHVRHLRVGADAHGDPASAVDWSTWRWLDIRAGLPAIVGATQERFVPQMVNLEALGGVDFKKGCYPGQEVVARSQYLGKLKRRMALASLAGDRMPAAGDDVFQADDAIGLVVSAERGGDGRVALLVELPITAFASDALTVGGSDGPSLTLAPLPYALPDNEVFVRPKL